MDIRVKYGLNNYFQPIMDNYIGAYPYIIERNLEEKEKYHYLLFKNIYNYFLIFVNFLRKVFQRRITRKKNRDWLFEKMIND